ncbi:MAG: hypothetical protein QOG43_530 [Actinomycetota bacterium]|jgi:saccharopine dehydrogenase-like NADP-dependent oxidoreductase|nr:hypothetical protein [Actinomycetota bacterium]
MGRVGLLVAEMLRVAGFDVRAVDRVPQDCSIPCEVFDVSNASRLASVLKDVDAVILCLPHADSCQVAEISASLGINYFDLTEDVMASAYIRTALASEHVVLAPQCGLAPGLVSIVGGYLATQYDTVHSIDLKVGALPWYPTGRSGYSVTWSAEGLVNEYIQPCDVIRGGSRLAIPALSGLESIEIDGVAFEACLTSGGLGTLGESLDGRIMDLSYKTLRYPGHFAFVRYLLEDLQLRDKPKVAAAALVRAYPPVDEDVVYLHAAATGTRGGITSRTEYGRVWRPIEFCGRRWRAISWTTAASLCGVVELVRAGAFGPGVLRQESIALESFSQTLGGKLLEKYSRSTTEGVDAARDLRGLAEPTSVGAPDGRPR